MIRPFPLAQLPAPVGEEQKRMLRTELRRLLEWQLNLRTWQVPADAPDAMPIVSLYMRGRLCGCAGMSEGRPAERLARAFVQALGDNRFGGIAPEARADLVCQVSYARAAEPIALAQASERLEAGTHGLALVAEGRPAAALLPDVAREHHLDSAGMLRALEHKAARPACEWPDDGLYLFETESVVARLAPEPELPDDPRHAAAAWLARQVDENGQVWFGLEPRTGERRDGSPMLHGRIAVALRALLSQSWGRGAAVRARRWLEQQIASALAGRSVPGFPDDPALIAGTLALAAMAGLDVIEALQKMACHSGLGAVPWHAAQVVAALGARAPESLWLACVRDLERDPWAPWTALAAHARGDSGVLTRCEELLLACVRARTPHLGGVGPGNIPELARTAATVEALSLFDSAAARTACARARNFLLRHQLDATEAAVARDPELVHGAFPVSPVHDFLQIDVTGHALLALASA